MTDAIKTLKALAEACHQDLRGGHGALLSDLDQVIGDMEKVARPPHPVLSQLTHIELRENVIGRLENWKFDSAVDYAEVKPGVVHDNILDAIKSIRGAFGNNPQFDGDLGHVVGYLVSCLIRDIKDYSVGEYDPEG